jgi:hypothetical protein
MRDRDESICGVEANADQIYFWNTRHSRENTLAVKARGPPKLQAANKKQQDERGDQHECGSPMKGNFGNAGNGGEGDKDGGGAGHEQQAHCSVGWQRFARGWITSLDGRCDRR